MNINSQAQENIDSMQQQIQEINKEFKRLYKSTNEIRKRFETVKMKRYNLMSECLERVAAEIDPVYKVGTFNHASSPSYSLLQIYFVCIEILLILCRVWLAVTRRCVLSYYQIIPRSHMRAV